MGYRIIWIEYYCVFVGVIGLNTAIIIEIGIRLGIFCFLFISFSSIREIIFNSVFRLWFEKKEIIFIILEIGQKRFIIILSHF